MQAAGKRVHPAIIDVEGRVCAIGDRVTEGANDYGVRRGHDVHRVQEEPGSRGEFECKDVQISRVIAAAGRGDVRGHIGAAVKGHRPTVALDGVADSQVAPLDTWIIVIGVFNPGQPDAVAKDLLADRYRHRLLAAESYRGEGVPYDVSGVFLESHGHAVEGHRLAAEDVGKTKSHQVAPEVGLDDGAEGLVGRPEGVSVGKRETEIGLNVGWGKGDGGTGRKGRNRRSEEEVVCRRCGPGGDPMPAAVPILTLITCDGGRMDGEDGNGEGYCCHETSGRASAKSRQNRRQHNSFSITCAHGDLSFVSEFPILNLAFAAGHTPTHPQLSR